jgi:hypothetical protein
LNSLILIGQDFRLPGRAHLLSHRHGHVFVHVFVLLFGGGACDC